VTSPAFELRPATAADEPFLLRLYASTRAEELAMVDWPDDRKLAFVEQQFTAQHRWYREQYADASFAVVLVDGCPAGRLYLAAWEGELRLVDVSLLPEFRGRGIGQALVRQVLAEGASSGKAVSIHVERFNRALRLYARLGFEIVEDKGVYLLLRWRPAAPLGPDLP
jgi:ribosomal protein S18 acetylase RimI-like enzyme